MLRPFTVLMKQTRAVKQSIFLDVFEKAISSINIGSIGNQPVYQVKMGELSEPSSQSQITIKKSCQPNKASVACTINMLWLSIDDYHK